MSIQRKQKLKHDILEVGLTLSDMRGNFIVRPSAVADFFFLKDKNQFLCIYNLPMRPSFALE